MKLKITIEGTNVQDIGFRAFLAEKALAWGIYNYQATKAWPEEDQSKLILKIEAEDKRIANFQRVLQKIEYKGVSIAKISSENYEGDIVSLSVSLSALTCEIGRRLDNLKHENQ
ncbi:MAG TPA: hypothetical protein VN455_00520 [Methanotrichaceae archaeon]|nr:hypothetical protein [Methanotrichaceae archaeon]